MKKRKLKKAIACILVLLTLLILIIGLVVMYSKPKMAKAQEEYILKYSLEEIVTNHNFNDQVNSIVTLKDNRYEARLFDNKTGKELFLQDVIKEGEYENFEKVINELIYLKYPSFIANVLTNNATKVYSLLEDRLVVYFYDYEINPTVEEELFLDVNYNEIAAFLTFPVPEDAEYERGSGYIIDSNKKHVAITFDDGPSKYTEELVQILDANKARSTFFMVGNKLNSMASAVKTVHDAHHEIGYHSYKHENFKSQTLATAQTEFQNSNTTLQNLIGEDFKLTRPPYGSLNATIKNGLATSFILWNVDTNDWRYRDTDYLYNYVLENIQDGDIILFHDSYETSIRAVEKLLPELYVQGYQLVTVSDLAALKGVTLKNNTSYYSFK